MFEPFLRFLRRLKHLLQFHQAEAGLNEELEFHRAMKRREIEERGLSGQEAAAAVHRAMGDTTAALEDSRGIWIASCRS